MPTASSQHTILERKLDYRFKRRNLLAMALRHPSARYERVPQAEDNQRLEFLGDAVLGLLAASYLYAAFQDKDEGHLTQLRSQLTSGKALGQLAGRIRLGAHVDIGKGEELSGGRHRESILADTMEALFGAIYLDGGFQAARRVFMRLFKPGPARLDADKWAGNPKGKLQDLSQRRWKHMPRYRVLSRKGPAHAAAFTVEVILPDGIRGVGTGRNMREAEVAAATHALSLLEHARGGPACR